MTRCPSCQHENPHGSGFCLECGSHLARACRSCGIELPAGSKFCNQCGAAAAAAGATYTTRFRAASAYTPQHPAERIGTSTAALEGERKQVTVLFADLKGSMELLTDRDPEEARKLLDPVLEHMMEAVHRYEGTVNQVLGDGILALFGAPVALEDHAVRACYAALAMQERISAYGDSVQRTHGIPIQIRVGLNSGEVVLRRVGDRPGALTALGQAVHLASRMERLAKPGTILATAETAALGARRVRTRALGPMNVKGLADPVEVFEITGAISSTARLETSSRLLLPFVGRDAELAQLTATLDVVRHGRGQLVAVTGEPGVGKSRIVQEFLSICRARGCVTLDASAQPLTRVTGQRVGLDIIRSYFGVDRTDAAHDVRHKVALAMKTLEPELTPHVSPVLWQLGSLEDGDPFWRLDGATRRQRAFEAISQLIAAQGRREPLVLVIENLQWVDFDAEDSLKLVTKALAPFILIVVTYRPEYDDAWVRQAGAVRVHLGPLGPGVASALLDALLGPGPEISAVKQVLAAGTGGNPFFIEECVRDLVHGGILAGEPGLYRLSGSVTKIHVPPTVRSVLEARIDRLSATDKRVLHCAAVIGQHVSSGLLDAVSELPAHETRAALRRLCEAEFLGEHALFPEPAYVFRHSLTQDVAYGDLLHEQRRALHAKVLASLESLHRDDPNELVDVLAHHAAQAEMWEHVVRYARQAAVEPRAGRGARETAALFEQALAALARLPDDVPHRTLAVDLRAELCRALVPLGEHPRMVSMLSEAEAIAAALADDTRLARITALLSFAYWEIGNSARAMECGERAVAFADRVGDPDLQVLANFGLGGAARAVGEYRRAVTLLRANLHLTDGARSADHFGLAGAASVLTRAHLAWSLAELGEFPEAVEHAEKSVRLAQTTPHAYSQAHAQLALGGTLLRQGRLAEAIVVLERGLDLCRDAPALYPPTAGDLGVIYTLSGRATAGVELAERAAAEAERMDRLGRLSLIVTHLGEAYFFAGRRADAAREGARALALALERGERGNQVYAHRLLALIAAEEQPPRVDTARHHFGTALVIAEPLGMRPLIARCHLGLGRLARRLGHAETARDHLSAATALFETMQMRYWLDRLALDRIGPAG